MGTQHSLSSLELKVFSKEEKHKEINVRLLFLAPNSDALEAVQKLKELNQSQKNYTVISKVLKSTFKTFGIKLQDDFDAQGNAIPAACFTHEDGLFECTHFKQGVPYNLHELACSYTLDQDEFVVRSSRWTSDGLKPNDDHINDNLDTMLRYNPNPEGILEKLQEIMDNMKKEKTSLKKVYLVPDYKPKNYTL
jgi:hypothetical protein